MNTVRSSVHRSSFRVPSLMWNDRLRIAESVAADWRALTADERAVLWNALEAIDDDPIIGAPLLEPLRGLWSYRAGDLRIVYSVVAEARFVVVLAITRVEEKPSL